MHYARMAAVQYDLFIPTTLLDGIRKRVEEEYAVMDEKYNNGNMTEEEYRHCYMIWYLTSL